MKDPPTDTWAGSVDSTWQGRGVTSPPSAEVLAEFGATGHPQPLVGGQRTVWRVGDVVLKRFDGVTVQIIGRFCPGYLTGCLIVVRGGGVGRSP